MKHLFKKTLGVCLIGLGLGILMVLLLPITGWLFIIGLGVACVGFIWLACWRKGDTYMTVVVKKVPKFLRGFVKLIFVIKDEKWKSKHKTWKK